MESLLHEDTFSHELICISNEFTIVLNMDINESSAIYKYCVVA